MTERWRTRAIELLTDIGRITLVMGLLWMGVDMARAQTPLAPMWAEADITASRSFSPVPANEPNQPVWRADPKKLLLVIEGGDDHVSLLDGDRLEVITRFPSRSALLDQPTFTPDGRHVFLSSRDGWITKYDLWRLRVVAEVRAGLSTRNLAVSGDGQWIMVANDQPQSLVLLDADLNLNKTYVAATLDGKQTSRVSAAYDVAPWRSFVIAFKDLSELWEVSYDPKAAPIYDGLVHDYRMGEAIAKPGFLGVRRTPLDEPLSDFFFDQSHRNVLATTRPKAKDGAVTVQVVNLDARRKIAELPIAGWPHLGAGISFAWNGTTVLASSNLKVGAIDVIDMTTWKLVTTIPTPGPGLFVSSHDSTPYAWTDSMLSLSAKDTITIIDKATLKPMATVREPGKTLAHVAFTQDGQYALASVSEMDGALIVFDAVTFKEIKRLPMSNPMGKYKAWNQITRSVRTSH